MSVAEPLHHVGRCEECRSLPCIATRNWKGAERLRRIRAATPMPQIHISTEGEYVLRRCIALAVLRAWSRGPQGENSEAFFLPYLWELVLAQTPDLNWKPGSIRLFRASLPADGLGQRGHDGRGPADQHDSTPSTRSGRLVGQEAGGDSREEEGPARGDAIV